MALRRITRAKPTLEQFQEKCVAVFRPELRNKKSERFRVSVKNGNALVVLLALVGCVSQPGKPGPNANTAQGQLIAAASAAPNAPNSQTATTLVEKDTPQPRMATYSCADGGKMTVENIGTAIRVMGSDGVNEELPAVPAGQNSRFGINHDAIVIDGREALVMKANATPVACRR